jgi:hypothetical protein
MRLTPPGAALRFRIARVACGDLFFRFVEQPHELIFP